MAFKKRESKADKKVKALEVYHAQDIVENNKNKKVKNVLSRIRHKISNNKRSRIIAIIAAVFLAFSGVLFAISNTNNGDSKQNKGKAPAVTYGGADRGTISNGVDPQDMNTPEEILKNYLDAYSKWDFTAMIKYEAIDYNYLIKETYTNKGLTEEQFNDLLLKNYNSKNITEYLNYTKENAIEECLQKYGENYKITYNVTGSKDLTETEIPDQIKKIQNDGTIKTIKNIGSVLNINGIGDICVFEIEKDTESDVDGESKVDTEKYEMRCVKISQRWYVLDIPTTNFMVPSI